MGQMNADTFETATKSAALGGTTSLISFAAHGLVVAAFQRGTASLLAPLQYVEIVSATLFGYLVFSDFPDGPTWVGIALIIASGLYIAHRERKKKSDDQTDTVPEI